MKHKPIHKWRLLDTVTVAGVDFFRYECQRCGILTLNGMPLAAPFKTECSRANRPTCSWGPRVTMFSTNLAGFGLTSR